MIFIFMNNFIKVNDPLLSYCQNPLIYDYIYIDNQLYINKNKEKLYIFNGIDKSKLEISQNEIKNNSIIYFEMGDGRTNLQQLINFLSKKSTYKHILLADGGDGTVYPFDLPENILHVFCPSFKFDHLKYSPFPRGILRDSFLAYKNLNIANIEKTDTLYCNFNTGHPEKNYDFSYWKEKSWAKTEYGITMENYYLNLFKHKFNICPFGVGSGLCAGGFADTYRISESIICKTIPIVRRSKLNENLKYKIGFPLLIVDSWDEITQERLETEYDDLVKNLNIDVVTESYWINKLRGFLNEV